MRRLISSGSSFEATIGYSRAVVQDGWVFVAGTTGYDYATMTLPEGVEDQCRNALATVAQVLDQAGSSLDHVVRVTYILPDRAEFPRLWPQLSAAFGTARPAATMIEARLMEDAMRFEIEVTARVAAG
ncbi:MAG: RidA family protein [Gemmobacter sp.]|uniref:RidA family protein n=1 Tax=Gemmobacter sp. TaxID=1898957 RepID=UPI00391948AE